MPNRLKEIFSADPVHRVKKFQFRSKEDYKKFMEDLEKIPVENEQIEVKYIDSILEISEDGSGRYPISRSEKVDHMLIKLEKESLSIPVKVGKDIKNILFWKHIKDERLVLETDSKSIVFIQLIFESKDIKKKGKLKLNYKNQFQFANNIREVFEAVNLTIAFILDMYKGIDYCTNEQQKEIKDIENYFIQWRKILKKLYTVEEILQISFSPLKLQKLSEEQKYDIEELYFLLCKNLVIRVNQKLDSANSSITMIPLKKENLKIGDEINLTFKGTIQFMILDQMITLHTANLLSNAVVMKIEKNAIGRAVKVFCGDTEYKPMYISFSAFKTQEEAEAEVKNIMNHKDDYVNACTSDEYLEREADGED